MFPFKTNQPTHAPGFTLIELLVVISIVIMLIGIVLAGTRHWFIQTRKATTQTVLRQIAGTLTEYTAVTRGEVPGINKEINAIIQDLKNNGGDSTELMLRSVNKKFWSPSYEDPDVVLIDSWGNEIEYVGPDGTNDNGAITGDITTTNQQPKHNIPYFASAGPDGEWGEFTNGNPYEPDDEAKDNIFSFDLSQSR